jgi:hypothetical protein
MKLLKLKQIKPDSYNKNYAVKVKTFGDKKNSIGSGINYLLGRFLYKRNTTYP